LISENNTITIPVIAQKLGKSEATIYRHIRSMMEASILVRVGARKKGHWNVLGNGSMLEK
jgi:ATP-dependent DNA helicase RecG